MGVVHYKADRVNSAIKVGGAALIMTMPTVIDWLRERQKTRQMKKTIGTVPTPPVDGKEYVLVTSNGEFDWVPYWKGMEG